MKTNVARKCANTTVDDEGRDSSHSPFEVHINTLILIVDGVNAVSYFVMRSKILKTWSCHLRARHGVHILAEINVALRDVLERSVTGFFTNETWLEQHFRAAPKSIMVLVVRPEAYKDKTVWVATYVAGTLNVSNMV